MRNSIALAVSISVVFSPSGLPEDPWADAVESYNATDPVSGYTTATAALGEPVGFSPSIPVNTIGAVNQVVSLGTPFGSPRSQLTVSFDTPIEDDSNNSMGLDFIVYSNAFWVGNNPQTRFQEPAIVEVSSDGTNWFMIPGSQGYSYAGGNVPLVTEPNGGNNAGDSSILAGTITNPNSTDGSGTNDNDEFHWGYAEMSPTLPAYLDNYLRPDDPFTVGYTSGSGGGDAFDIAWAINASGALANLSSISFVRITPFIDRTLTVGFATPEIMAIVDVAADIDTDGDGILDDYETRVIDTDPMRAENTLLPLEIPATEGGSPDGTLLGVAQMNSGNEIRLYSTGSRTSTIIDTIVDLTTPAPPAGTIIGAATQLSDATLQIDSTSTDFQLAEVDWAEVSIRYLPSHIVGSSEANLEPYRLDGGDYVQSDIINIQRDSTENLITFEGRYSGMFVLASTSGSGKIRSSEVWVDFDHLGIQTGSQATPYSDIAEGLLAVTSGGTLRLISASDSETITIDQTVTLDSEGGLVQIGLAIPPDIRQTFSATNPTADSGFISTPIQEGSL